MEAWTLPAIGALTATIFLWAGSFAAIRASVAHFGPLPLTSARLLVAALAFAVLGVAVRIRLPARADWGRLLLAGLLGMSGYQLLLNSGQVRVTAATASVIIATSPVIAVLLARAMLGERLTVLRAMGVAVAFVGAAIAAGGDSTSLRLEPASLLIFAAAASQAGYFVVMKPLLATYSPVEATAWATWLAALSALPLAVDLPKVVVAAPTEAHVAVLALGIGSSGVGYLAWSIALRHLDASTAAVHLYLVPPTAAGLAWLWLGERPTLATALGGALTLAGVSLARRKTVSPPRPAEA